MKSLFLLSLLACSPHSTPGHAEVLARARWTAERLDQLDAQVDERSRWGVWLRGFQTQPSKSRAVPRGHR